jgi:glycosyltransferase involved in cell wall biosynthesis
MSAPSTPDPEGRTTVSFLSVVIPVYNEEATLPELYRRLTEVLSGRQGGLGYEIVLVNDGSTDRSMALLLEFHSRDARVKVLELSRNFGHPMALSAGIDHASGDPVILMDGDLQDPPEFIPQMLDKWMEGFEVVNAIRMKRKEGIVKRIAFFAFYRILNQLSTTPMPLDVGIFSLMDRKVVTVLRSMPERNRYLSGLRAWAGFRQVGVECERAERFYSIPRQTIGRLSKLALDALFSFSDVPLKVASFVGLIVSLLAFLVGLYALYAKLFTSKAIPGWTSVLVATTFLGGLILVTLGVIGEYLFRVYDEVKQRPRYVVARKVGLDQEGATLGAKD